jgi:hypothetical protein
MNTEEVKQTKEYKELIKMGFKDATTPREYKVGSLKFDAAFDRDIVFYSISKNGILTENPGSFTPNRLHHFGTMRTLEDYQDVLRVLAHHMMYHKTRLEIARKKAKKIVIEHAHRIVHFFFEEIEMDYFKTTGNLVQEDPIMWSYEILNREGIS